MAYTIDRWHKITMRTKRGTLQFQETTRRQAAFSMLMSAAYRLRVRDSRAYDFLMEKAKEV